MKTSEFDFTLPPSLIAQSPARPRDAARLMRVDRQTGAISHHTIRDLPALLDPGDLCVMNDSRVIRARLSGILHGKYVEVLLLEPLESAALTPRTWSVLIGPGKHAHPGDVISLEHEGPRGIIRTRSDDGIWTVSWDGDLMLYATLHGALPIPPYIKALAQEDDYQTIYAASDGSVAAPTAGLHFTPAVLRGLDDRGILRATITLHVGVGTFRPIKTETLDAHRMHEERYMISRYTMEKIAMTKKAHHRVIAVGTTSMRTLESSALHPTGVDSVQRTSIFIQPGFPFRMVDGLLTNFHLPKSSLLVLVSAFAGVEHIRHAYAEAIREHYRFYSFGDAMLIL